MVFLIVILSIHDCGYRQAKINYYYYYYYYYYSDLFSLPDFFLLHPLLIVFVCARVT
jgi:hypothetical protein